MIEIPPRRDGVPGSGEISVKSNLTNVEPGEKSRDEEQSTWYGIQ